MKKLILKCSMSLGDITMLTAAVRDLHRCYPHRFWIDIRTPYPALWDNNPQITPIEDGDPASIEINCEYPLINVSNRTPHHLIHGFTQFLNRTLDLQIIPSEFKGDIYLSRIEKQWASQVHEITGDDKPFWIIVAGGKYDFTTKWWDFSRYQEIVDHFKDRIQFVQVGDPEHYHPPLRGAINLVGKTNIRQLVRLVYHARGVICPVTSLMHLAAAVETKPGMPKNRACVVIAGGREPSQWEAYPHHQYIHTNGSLPCCDQGGCWKSRTVPLGDGDERDRPENLCVNVVGSLPRCMDMIKSQDVIRRVALYFEGGSQSYLQPSVPKASTKSTHPAIKPNQEVKSDDRNHLEAANSFIKTITPTPRDIAGDGIIICGGGMTYFTNAWVNIRILRHLGCSLPIELWYLDKNEITPEMQDWLSGLDVTCINADNLRASGSNWELHGWNLKIFAVLRSRLARVLYLDADNICVKDPTYLFAAAEFQRSGALFWSDRETLKATNPIWRLCGVRYRNEPAFESGQFLVDKKKVWRSLCLTGWYNHHSHIYYRDIYGDKDTFHMAFRKIGESYLMPKESPKTLGGALCHHDFEGRLIFQHRCSDKWSLEINTPKIKGFYHERRCRRYLKELREKWNPRSRPARKPGLISSPRTMLINELVAWRHELHLGNTSQSVAFTRDYRIETSGRDKLWNWQLHENANGWELEVLLKGEVAAKLSQSSRVLWSGVVDKTLKLRRQPRIPKGIISLRASINSYSGYGLHAIQIVSESLKAGYDVQVIPIGYDERLGSIPEYVRQRVVRGTVKSRWQLLLYSPTTRVAPDKKSIYFTMWETDALSSKSVRYLNEAEAIIVPCRWNIEVFRSSGVTRPIFHSPLGINLRRFALREFVPQACIFGTGGRMAAGGMRKGIDMVISAFSKAFPSEKDVFLRVKAFPDCELPAIRDPRISLTQKYLSEKEMADWYGSLTCFVSASKGEGWGLMQQQAMATGRPVISIAYGGVGEFFDKAVGYPVDYKLVPAEGYYEGCGSWAEINEDSLIDQMREVYFNRDAAMAKGRKSARQVESLSWRNANNHLINILRNLGMWGDAF
jgi:glycosyltransferase involved in cell wall biosynthesis/ADP-heptose:LPS heptosyltransferase